MRAPLAIDSGTCPEERWDDPARGSLRWKTLLSQGVTESDSLVCGIALMEPGDFFALHSHPEAEVYFGLEGEGEVTIDGQPHRLAPGIALFIPGGALHGVPRVSAPLKWFYTFARDSFDQIAYTFRSDPNPTPRGQDE
ncbi:cupin domain-containing protein [Gemmobacter caeruleus]|uniref:cupin domain-containing protein n=1 Tax=Gemmobacter caeruleus TaxID=2595004 RepID=UPI0011ECC364|nr:cupin domain-containing protein [Gemmobacter caeruleus]